MEAIDLDALADVTGGRKTPVPAQVPKEVTDAMTQMAQAIKGAGEQRSQTELEKQQQMFQFLGEMKRGR